MRQITGPKSKLARRVGKNIPVKGAKLLSPNNPFNKRPFPPGIRSRGRPARASEYGIQIKEKQAIKNTYALSDRNMYKYYQIASNDNSERSQFDVFYSLLEMRLDNLVYRAGFASTRQQARQMVTHESFNLNGRKAKTPSIILKVGDEISLKKIKMKPLIESNLKHHISGPVPKHLRSDEKNLTISVIDTVNSAEADPELNFISTLEFYSKR
jgi:small subunit ribosomal protein S4